MCRNPSSKNQEETNSSARNLRSAYYLGSVETNEGYSESAVWLPAQTFAYREFPIAFFLSSDSRHPRAAKPMRVCPDFSGAWYAKIQLANSRYCRTVHQRSKDQSIKDHLIKVDIPRETIL